LRATFFAIFFGGEKRDFCKEFLIEGEEKFDEK